MPPVPALPISLYLQDRRVVLVGDGPGAAERLERLSHAGAEVVQIAPKDYSLEHVRAAFAVVAHSADDDLNLRVAADARAAGALAYAHDQPASSDFAMPALVRRGPLKLAISTDAVAPALSRRLREELERLFDTAGTRLDALIADMQSMREALPRGKRGALYTKLARRLHLDGSIRIDDEASEP